MTKTIAYLPKGSECPDCDWPFDKDRLISPQGLGRHRATAHGYKGIIARKREQRPAALSLIACSVPGCTWPDGRSVTVPALSAHMRKHTLERGSRTTHASTRVAVPRAQSHVPGTVLAIECAGCGKLHRADPGGYLPLEWTRHVVTLDNGMEYRFVFHNWKCFMNGINKAMKEAVDAEARDEE